MNDESSIQEPLDGSYLIDGKVLFNVVLNEITYEDKQFKLAYTESKTLLLLIHHLGDIVARERIIEYGWGGRVVSDASLAKSISNLRKVLRECTLDDESILTVPRVGYRFTLSAELRSPALKEDGISIDASKDVNSDEASGKTLIDSVDLSFNDEVLSLATVSNVNKKKSSHFLNIMERSISPSIKRSLKFGMYALSLLMFSVALYKVTIIYSDKINNEFIAKGYKKSIVTIDNKSYNLISMSGFTLSEDVLSLVSLSPSHSTIFYRSGNGIVNLSFFIESKAVSFTYQEKNFIKARCAIRDVLSEGSRICER